MVRGVVFIDNETAKLWATKQSLDLEEPVEVFTTCNGLYPISPKEIRDCFELEEGVAIIELMCEPIQGVADTELISRIDRENIISVNLNTGNMFYPYRMFKPYCMFVRDTDILKDDLGWKHPMPGISWLRNKQCMRGGAYKQMMETISNYQGDMVVEYIEKLFQNTIMTEDIILEYKL